MTDLHEYIAANELDWWIRKRSRVEVRKLINESTGANIKAKDFKGFLGDHCKIYSVWKRKSMSKQRILSDAQWEKLKDAVRILDLFICGVGIDTAVEIIRSRVSTNKFLLKGLPKRLHYWE